MNKPFNWKLEVLNQNLNLTITKTYTKLSDLYINIQQKSIKTYSDKMCGYLRGRIQTHTNNDNHGLLFPA